MAEFVVATGIAPSEYKALTLLERDELAKAVERRDKAMSK